MKQLKIFGFAAIATMALTAFLGAGSASATTLEETGVTRNSKVTITLSLEPGTSSVTRLTSGAFLNTCKKSHVHWTTSVFTGTDVSGPVEALAFEECTTEKVTVDKAGTLDLTWIPGTTNGTLTSTGTELTIPSPIGNITCKTGAGVDIGTLTGVAAGQATIDIKAVLNCGIFAPSAIWEASYLVTIPHGLGVSS